MKFFSSIKRLIKRILFGTPVKENKEITAPVYFPPKEDETLLKRRIPRITSFTKNGETIWVVRKDGEVKFYKLKKRSPDKPSDNQKSV